MMKTSPMIRGLVFVGLGSLLLLVGLGSLLGCGVAISELQALNPQARTLQVPCHPWQVRENVKVLAARVSSNEVDHIVTDETPGALIDYAQDASVFIEINKAAPRENAQIMASEYGLICQQDLAVRSTPLDALREEKPCSMQANTAGSSNYLGTANSQPCNPGAGGPTNGPAGSAPAELLVIKVCARAEGISSDEWYGGKGITADVKTKEEHEAQVAKATVKFVLDKSAPPESVWHFGPKTKARCPGKAPIPYDQWVAQNAGTSTQQAASGSSGAGKQQTGLGNAGSGTAGTNTTAGTVKTGSGKPSASSSPNSQGPQLDTLEASIRQFAIAAALFQADTSGNLKDPNGSRYGIPNGKNVGGPNALPLQAIASLFVVVKNPLKTGKDFIKTVTQALEKKEVLIILDPAHLSKEVAEELAKDRIGPDGKTLISGKVMAESLKNAGTIMPYSRAQIFTRGWINDFQAHHIFEESMMKQYKEYGTDAIANSPAIILTKAQHLQITKDLTTVRNQMLRDLNVKQLNKQQVWALYQKVYAKYPTWLEAIKPYFQP